MSDEPEARTATERRTGDRRVDQSAAYPGPDRRSGPRRHAAPRAHDAPAPERD